MTEHLLCHPGVRVRVFAQAIHLLLAEETVAARDWERDDHAVAHLSIFNFRSNLNDLAHELVAEYVALLHRRDEMIIEMKVGAADCGRANFYDCVALIQNLRVWNLLNPHVLFAVPAVRSHSLSPFQKLTAIQQNYSPSMKLTMLRFATCSSLHQTQAVQGAASTGRCPSSFRQRRRLHRPP